MQEFYMDKLKNLRRKIDDIDDMLLKLLNLRAKTALKIGDVKRKEAGSAHLFRPERQADIISRLINKKGNKISEADIFYFWRKIFFLQTKIQGTIEYFCLSSFNNTDKQEAFSFFGNEIDLKKVDTINKGFSVVSKKSNRLLLLKYPTMKRSTQWLHLLEKNRLFVVSSIPLILGKREIPRFLIVTRNQPVLDGEITYLYFSNRTVNKKGVKLLYKIKNTFIYQTNLVLKYEGITSLGAYPSNIFKK